MTLAFTEAYRVDDIVSDLAGKKMRPLNWAVFLKTKGKKVVALRQTLVFWPVSVLLSYQPLWYVTSLGVWLGDSFFKILF